LLKSQYASQLPQDYLTKVKKSIIAKSYYTTPPQQKDKLPSVQRLLCGNNATQNDKFKPPINPGLTAANTTVITTNLCCLGSGAQVYLVLSTTKMVFSITRISEIKH
jgi:hypothetical protein